MRFVRRGFGLVRGLRPQLQGGGTISCRLPTTRGSPLDIPFSSPPINVPPSSFDFLSLSIRPCPLCEYTPIVTVKPGKQMEVSSLCGGNFTEDPVFGEEAGGLFTEHRFSGRFRSGALLQRSFLSG